jgi:hypothetical protein
MDEAAVERLRIAVRVLNSQHLQGERVTDAEIAILKSYLRGRDLSDMPIEEIAAAVIRRELHMEPERIRRTHGRTSSASEH